MGIEVGIARDKHWEDYGGMKPEGIVVNVILHRVTASVWGLDQSAVGAAVGNYAYIFFPDVVRALDLSLDRRSLIEPRIIGQLARAVGRVAAHEVIHIVAPCQPHAEEGLMTAQLTKRSLTRRSLHVDPVTADYVLNRLHPGEKAAAPLVVTSPAIVTTSASKQR
jgi:hypothetical protein